MKPYTPPIHGGYNSGGLGGYNSGVLGGYNSGAENVYAPSEAGNVSNSRSHFAYDELVQATDGFSAKNLLGEGGFGCVYKGVLADKRDVAVKQLKIGSGQGEREFQAEVEIISRIHHRHLVSLVGYCTCDRQRLLVYEYIPNDTLHYHLHGKEYFSDEFGKKHLKLDYHSIHNQLSTIILCTSCK